MRVLDRPPVSRKAGEDGLRISENRSGKEAGMGEETLDHRDKRPEREAVARRERGGGARSSVRVR